jgi:hypothetical protein
MYSNNTIPMYNILNAQYVSFSCFVNPARRQSAVGSGTIRL